MLGVQVEIGSGHLPSTIQKNYSLNQIVISLAFTEVWSKSTSFQDCTMSLSSWYTMFCDSTVILKCRTPTSQSRSMYQKTRHIKPTRSVNIIVKGKRQSYLQNLFDISTNAANVRFSHTLAGAHEGSYPQHAT